MRLQSNVGMIKGNKTAHNYAEHLKFNVNFKKKFSESRNAKGVRWLDILNMILKTN